MLSTYKSKVEPIADLLAKPFMKVDPNILTSFGLLFPLLFFYFLVRNYYFAAILIYPAVLFDFVDGHVARNTGKVSKFGGVLDSTLDRLSDGLIISSFGVAGLVRWEIVVALLVFSYLISYVRSRAELAGKAKFKLDLGVIERAERLGIIYVGLIIFCFFPRLQVFEYSILEVFFILLSVLSVVTVIQRLHKSYLILK